MGEIEQQLKRMIIEKYGNVKNFAAKIGMPYTTLDSILKRGVAKSSSVNLAKIVNELRLHGPSLLNGEIVASNSIWDDEPGHQEWLISKVLIKKERTELLRKYLNAAKEIILDNDAANVFTDIPEEELLWRFWLLNSNGQEKAIEQLDMITSIPEYQKDPETKTAAPEREPQDGETDTQ